MQQDTPVAVAARGVCDAESERVELRSTRGDAHVVKVRPIHRQRAYAAGIHDQTLQMADGLLLLSNFISKR